MERPNAPDPKVAYAALRARDRRFDGTFFVGVSTTGVYCRPICPARLPRFERCSFYRTAAEAEREGFRACFRCRPELAPEDATFAPVGSAAAVDASPDIAARARLRIDEGALDDGSVDTLAGELGVTARHLRRVVLAAFGVTPSELAGTRRIALAKRLLQDSSLSITEVAFASGFASLRRFNAHFRTVFDRAPSDVRRVAERGGGSTGRAVTLRLDYRPPFAWDALLAFFASRQVGSIECVDGATFARVLRVGDATGVVRVSHDAARSRLVVDLAPSLAPRVATLVPLLRAAFDLDARPTEIDAHLATDPLLARSVRRAPGLRLPGAFDPFEIVVRAIGGQRISVAAATTLVARFVAAFGDAVAHDPRAPSLSHAFPTPSRVASATPSDIAALGLPVDRARTIVAVAQRFARGALVLRRHAPLVETSSMLESVPGIGPWTASYVALRATGHPDAFLPSDLVVRRALDVPTPAAASTRAEPWAPWRSYAVLHLWRLHAETNAAARKSPRRHSQEESP
ncbi:MAG: AlkA N-terminal domain-containing protein [Polyangiaceae bacterium]